MRLPIRSLATIVSATSLVLTIFGVAESAAAQDQAPSLDINGDGTVSFLAFGDSITYGVGDGIAPGVFNESIPAGSQPGGYPKRVASLLGVSVTNGGVPGEEFLTAGVDRFPTFIANKKSDFVIFLEGANDAVKLGTGGEYARSLQKIINVAHAEGKQMVLITTLPPVGVHAALAPFTSAYANEIRDLASVNDTLLADGERAWSTSCPVIESCRFYNLPEGLHPNKVGYDALSQTVLASILGIDIFAPTGAADLEGALGLPAGTVVVKPG